MDALCKITAVAFLLALSSLAAGQAQVEVRVAA
jgi:hypothetical protein